MKRLLSVCVIVLCLSGIASAASTVDLISPGGTDSGWSAVFDPNHTDVIVDTVTSTYVRVEVFKNFDQGPAQGGYVPNEITFVPRLGNARKIIQITDESIVNNTASDWTDYHWQVTGSNVAFDSASTTSSGFSIDPFTQLTWSNPISAGYYENLSVSGGVVADGDAFTPGLDLGHLDINANVVSGSSPTSFQLEQYPTPEPATVVLLAAGAVALVRRRRAKHA